MATIFDKAPGMLWESSTETAVRITGALEVEKAITKNKARFQLIFSLEQKVYSALYSAERVGSRLNMNTTVGLYVTPAEAEVLNNLSVVVNSHIR